MTDVTDKAKEKLKASGWTVVETTGFLHLIGPLWQRVVDGMNTRWSRRTSTTTAAAWCRAAC